MKKSYISPTIVAVKLQHSGIICTSPVSIQGLSTNLGDDAIGYGGAGSGPARARQHSGIDWDDEW